MKRDNGVRSRESVFVHIDLGDGMPVVAARAVIDFSVNSCRFVYGKSYLANPKAFSLDPINLPLDATEKVFMMSRFNQTGLPGVLLDGGPDGWGKRVLNRVLHIPPANDVDYLVLGSGTGVGALYFSDATDAVIPESIPSGFSLAELCHGASVFDSDLVSEVIPYELQECFLGTTAIGGARPKTQVIHKGKAYIAKFNRDIDTFNNAATEYAVMRCCRDAGIDTANVELVHTDVGSVLLVERFDDPLLAQAHFISANSLLNIQTLAQSTEEASYIAIAEICRKLTVDKAQVLEFFKRMVFNIAIGCTDDHTRNHGFIKIAGEARYRLSPAYDVVPFPERIGSHAIALGEFGMTPTIDNVASAAKRMGIANTQMKQVISEVLAALSQLDRYFDDGALSDKDRRVVSQCFRYQPMLASMLD